VSELRTGEPVELTDDQTAALFRVLWYADRVNAVYESPRPPLRGGRITRTRALLIDSLGATIDIWTTYLGYGLVTENGKAETDGSDQGLRDLADKHRRLCKVKGAAPARASEILAQRSRAVRFQRSSSLTESGRLEPLATFQGWACTG
jgi:hypothetical protein